MAKLERKAYITLLDASFGDGDAEWFVIGKDIDDMSVELNPDTETVKNILGETSVKDNGYEPSLTVEPYYANPDDDIYDTIKDIAMNRKKGDACKTKILEIMIDKTSSPYDAWQEDVVVKPTSYGGDTSGVAIPFEVHFDGNRKKGTASKNSSTGAWEFTESSN